MKFTHSLLLFLVGFVLLAMSLILGEQQQNPKIEEPFLSPEMRHNLAQVNEIKISSAGNSLLIKAQYSRQENLWRLSNHHNVIAETWLVNRFLTELNQLKSWQKKTANKDNYHFLGLSDISNVQAQGLEVTLIAGKIQETFIVGLADLNNGYYMRKKEQSYAVKGQLTLPTSVLDWLKTDLLKLSANDIETLEVINNDLADKENSAQRYTIERLAKKAELTSKVKEQTNNPINEQAILQSTFKLTQVNGNKAPLPTLKYQSILSFLPETIADLEYISVINKTPQTELSRVNNNNSVLRIKVTLSNKMSLSNKINRCYQFYEAQGQYWLLVDSCSNKNNLDKEISQYYFQISPHIYRLLAKPLSSLTSE